VALFHWFQQLAIASEAWGRSVGPFVYVSIDTQACAAFHFMKLRCSLG
jgi:hypothetical protein